MSSLGAVPASTLGLPGDAAGASSQDDFARPRRPGSAAGVRAAEAVLGGRPPLVIERDGPATTGSGLGSSGFPLSGALSGG